jgi:hypothetical protein
MTFVEALQLLKEGEAICREGWGADQYLILLQGMEYVWKIILPPNTNAGNHIFSFAEYIAEDWKKYVQPVIDELATPANEAKEAKEAKEAEAA